MKLNIKTGTVIAAAGALAIAVPAAAHPGPPSQPGVNGHANGHHHGNSHKCKPHNSAYVEGGTVDGTTTLKPNPDGTWSGNLVVHVTHANHAARADRGQTVTYLFTNAKLTVHFDNGAPTTGFTDGEQIQLIGKEATVAKKCAALDPAPAPVFRMLVVQPSAPAAPTAPTAPTGS